MVMLGYKPPSNPVENPGLFDSGAGGTHAWEMPVSMFNKYLLVSKLTSSFICAPGTAEYVG